MNKRLFAVAGVMLCAVIAYASVVTVRNRSRASVAPNAANKPVKLPTNGVVQVVSTPPGSSKVQEVVATDPVAANVPDYVVYWHLFRYHNYLRQKADELESRGEDGSFIRNFHQREARLDDAQATTLSEIAAQCETDVRAVDAEAKLVIDRLRAQHASEGIQPDQPVPPPSPELLALQEQRNSLILRARDQLQRVLGPSAFNEFQTYVREQVATQIAPKTMDSLRSVGRDSSQREPQVNPHQEQR